jgi:hypothetical protein
MTWRMPQSLLKRLLPRLPPLSVYASRAPVRQATSAVGVCCSDPTCLSPVPHKHLRPCLQSHRRTCRVLARHVVHSTPSLAWISLGIRLRSRASDSTRKTHWLGQLISCKHPRSHLRRCTRAHFRGWRNSGTVSWLLNGTSRPQFHH